MKIKIIYYITLIYVAIYFSIDILFDLSKIVEEIGVIITLILLGLIIIDERKNKDGRKKKSSSSNR